MEEILAGGEHERVVLCSDPAANYRSVIAVHSTRLGPAVGGARLWRYGSLDEAVTDALRLSRGMTYKNALAGLPFGGGKTVILSDENLPIDREKLFRAHGRFVERLGGSYITAEDVGTSPDDMEHVRRETTHVGGLWGESGDPSPVTARGVFRAIQAAVKHRRGSPDVKGLRVALQGCGHVGYHLARELREAGAQLIVTDVDGARASRVAEEFGATPVGADEIYDADADLFAPCALGGVLNDETIPRLKVGAVTGAANNQLLEARHGDALAARRILYAPDYAANVGGVINGCIELLGWEPARSRRKVEEIYDTLLAVFAAAEAEGISTARAADRIAEQRLARGVEGL